MGSRIIPAFTQFFDDSNQILSNGWLRFSVSGSVTSEKATYADAAETTANTNPYQLDAAGRCGDIFGTGEYKARLYRNDPNTDQPGELIDEFDPVPGGLTSSGNWGSWNSEETYPKYRIVTGDDNKYYISLQDNNKGNEPSGLPTDEYWMEVKIIFTYNSNKSYLENDVMLFTDNYLYVASSDTTAGETPTTNPEKWVGGPIVVDINGGVDSGSDTSDVTLTSGAKRVQYRSQDANGRFYTLPAASVLNKGFTVFTFYNTGDYRYGIKDTDGNFICSVGPAKAVSIDLIDDTVSAEVWKIQKDPELFMNHLKAVFTSASIADLITIKLGSTEVIATWEESSIRYGGVFLLTASGYEFYGSALNTPHQITTENTTDSGLCTVKENDGSTAQALLVFTGSDNHGNAQMLEWNASTKVLSNKGSEFEFQPSYARYPTCTAFSETKILVAFVNNSFFERALVLDWTDPTLSVDTVETAINSNAVRYLLLCQLSGSSSAGTVVLSSTQNTVYNKWITHITWNGTTLVSAGNVTASISQRPDHAPMIPLGSDYFCILLGNQLDTTSPVDIKLVIYYWSGTSFIRRKSVSLFRCISRGGDIIRSSLYLIDSDNIGLAITLDNYTEEFNFRFFKIRIKGAAALSDNILTSVSELELFPSGVATSYGFSGFDPKNAIFVKGDTTENSGYLTAEKIEVG